MVGSRVGGRRSVVRQSGTLGQVKGSVYCTGLTSPGVRRPEYLKNVTEAVGDICVYTARLDRGLSPPDVLETLPGTRWDEERGLNENGYIVPGAGGMGEVLNNSWC